MKILYPFYFKNMQKLILLFIVIFLILESYAFIALKNITQNPIAKSIYIGINTLVYITLLYLVFTTKKGGDNTLSVQIMMSILTLFVLPKLIIIAFLLLEDIIRFISWCGQYFMNGKPTYYPERRKFISVVGLGLAGVLTLLFTDGIIFGKYRHRAKRIKLKIPNLPKSFKGYKIVQISDVHSGSFSDPNKLKNAIRLINEQNADLILFTGDMVNNQSSEFKPFISLFSSIQSKDGKFSILGNHDYGLYNSWNSDSEKENDLSKLIEYQAKAGFRVLRNENKIISKNNEKLYILGVENWGIKPFPQFGDLEKSLKDVPNDAIKILMSHDPSHFDEIVKKHPTDVHLTLSGHTHGMQFGLDLKNIKWSPVQYKYPKWAGLYKENNRFLYVNKGFGVLAYPGRVGMNPEITVFELA